MRYVPGNPSAIGWRPNASNTVIVSLPEAAHAPTLAEGKELARVTLARLASGAVAAEERAYEPPVQPQRIGELQHAEKMLVALVLRWPDVFEVRTIGYVPCGFTLPVATPSITQDPDHEWGRLDLFERLLSDTEEEAWLAAAAELDRLAESDIPVEPRIDQPRTTGKD